MTEHKIKILHLFYMGGGIATSVNLITKNTNPNLFEHVVVDGLSKEAHKKPNDLLNFKIHSLKITRNIHLIKDLLLIYKILKICKKEKPDLIHAHSAKGGIIGKIVAFLHKTNCLHTPQAYSYLSTKNPVKRKIYLGIEKTLKHLPHKILACSTSEANRSLKDLKYPLNRVILFPNAIEPIRDIKKLSIKKTWPDEYICTVGRPSYQKNIELMVNVVYELKKDRPDIHLVIMGVGFYSPNIQSVKEKIDKLQLNPNITLLNWTSREDIFNIIYNSQIYISTARYEGLPYAVIEALALGKALVLSDVDGNRDLVEPNKNGYLINSEEPEDYKQRIDQLLNNNDKKLNFESHSLELFKKYYNIEKTIKNLETIYKTESL